MILAGADASLKDTMQKTALARGHRRVTGESQGTSKDKHIYRERVQVQMVLVTVRCRSGRVTEDYLPSHIQEDPELQQSLGLRWPMHPAN